MPLIAAQDQPEVPDRPIYEEIRTVQLALMIRATDGQSRWRWVRARW
jgi:hypothetical protein